LNADLFETVFTFSEAELDKKPFVIVSRRNLAQLWNSGNLQMQNMRFKKI